MLNPYTKADEALHHVTKGRSVLARAYLDDMTTDELVQLSDTLDTLAALVDRTLLDRDREPIQS